MLEINDTENLSVETKKAMFQAVVFDMDGVIFDSEIKVIECWKEIAKKHGIQEIEKACFGCLGLNREAARSVMLSIYGEDFPYDEYKSEMSALFHMRYGEGRLPLKKGIVELLQYLQKKGIRTAIASSTRREVVEAEIKDAGLMPYFQAVICGDMVKRSKPEPDIFLKACKELQVEPAVAIGIEDSYYGVQALYRAGMRPVMVPDLKEPTEEIRQLAEVVLPDLFAVKNYLVKQRQSFMYGEPDIPDCGCIYG